MSDNAAPESQQSPKPPAEQNDIPPAESPLNEHKESLLENLGDENKPADSSQPPEPAPPAYRYRVVMSPPADIQAMIDKAVKAIKLEHKHVPGCLKWQAEFQTQDERAVVDLIQAWVNEHMPLQTELTEVYSAVQGPRTYVTGWKLAPTETLQAAHRHLTAGLGSIITIDATANTTFQPWFVVSPDVPAERFPHLVAHLQQHFNPIDWEMTGCELQRQPINSDSGRASTVQWETAHTITQEQP